MMASLMPTKNVIVFCMQCRCKITVPLTSEHNWCGCPNFVEPDWHSIYLRRVYKDLMLDEHGYIVGGKYICDHDQL